MFVHVERFSLLQLPASKTITILAALDLTSSRAEATATPALSQGLSVLSIFSLWRGV
jgi:hypothetical protein